MQKERLVGLIMSIIVSASMGVVSAVLVTTTNPDSLKAHSAGLIYASNIILSVILGAIIAFIGASMARKAGAVPPSMKFILINALPISIGNTFIISFILSFVGVLTARMKLPAETLSHLPPFPVMWLGNWGKLLIPTLLISYTLSVLLAPIVARIVGVKGPPKGAGPRPGPQA